MLVLNADAVRKALPMSEAIEAMKSAFDALTRGAARLPPRTHLHVERNAGLSLFMPALVDDPEPSRQALCIKAVSLFDHNQTRGLPRIQAAVLVLDPATGTPQAVVEGATLTGIRTAAASGAATDLLARTDSSVLGILGAGVQARTHLEAVCCVRPIERVRIYGPTPSNVEQLVEEMAGRKNVRLEVAATADDAVASADIVCCTTNSPTPVFSDASVRPGTHLNAIGSFQPDVCEIPEETVLRARVVVDSHEAAWEEAGDLIQPLRRGSIDKRHVLAELGELIAGREIRTDPAQITFFKSVGVAVQDAFAAAVALRNARSQGLGQRVDW